MRHGILALIAFVCFDSLTQPPSFRTIIYRPAGFSACPRGIITCNLCLLDAGLPSRVAFVSVLLKSTLFLEYYSQGLCCCDCRYRYSLVRRLVLQGAKVLRHDQPLPDAPGGEFRHGLPVRNQDERLVEHLLRRLSAFSVLHSAHDGHEDAHLLAVLLPLGVVVDILGGAHGKGRVKDMGIERFYLIMHILALDFEEF
jgi:hypothetical protein